MVGAGGGSGCGRQATSQRCISCSAVSCLIPLLSGFHRTPSGPAAACHNATYVLSDDSKTCTKVCGSDIQSPNTPGVSFGPNAEGRCACTTGYRLSALSLDLKCELICGAALPSDNRTSFFNVSSGSCGECCGCAALQPACRVPFGGWLSHRLRDGASSAADMWCQRGAGRDDNQADIYRCWSHNNNQLT